MRFPWTIWRQIFLDLWRLLSLTAGVLVVVISFAVSVRLTAQGKLGPWDTIKYMFLLMPPMLQFTLPFAAAFGATLSYHRMSQDNELTAAAAGGISHRRLLIPALASGVLLACVMSLLLDELAPRFFRQMERMLAQDAARMVVTPIEAGQTLDLGGSLVHADGVRRLGPNPEHDALETLLLTGVFVVDIDDKGRILREAAASQAVVEFSGEGGGAAEATADEPGQSARPMSVAIRLINPSVFLPEEGVRPTIGAITLYETLPTTYEDNPKFRTTRELLDLPAHPDNLRFIDGLRRRLAVCIAERDTTATIDAALKAKGAVQLMDEAGRTLTIHAAGIRWAKDRWELLPAAGKGGKIDVDLTAEKAGASEAGTLHLSAQSGGLRSDVGKEWTSHTLTLRLGLETVAGRMKAGDPAGVRESQFFPHLALADNPLPELLKLSTPRLLAEVDRRSNEHPTDPFIAAPEHELREVLAEVGREIVSKHHERWASCVSALIMVLAGALTAMRLGASLPLTVYLWSFFPALLSVVTIAMGQQTAHKIGIYGLGILWAGVAVLAAYTVSAFVVVKRH